MASNSTSLYCSAYPSSSPYTLSVSIVENSTNQVNNTSNITITATISSGGIHFSEYYTPILYVSYKDNGSQPSYTAKASTGVTYITSNTSSWTVTWTGDVTHKSDGTLTGTAEAVWDWKTSNTGYAPYSGSVSVSLNMTTIARAGSINATPSSANVATTNGSTIFTATVTPANSAFYHYVYAQIGSAYALTGRWAEDNAYTFRVNDTSILSAIGNSTSATITFTCKTYATKSTSGTLIGTTTVSRSVTVNTSVIKPTLTGVSASIKTTPVASNMVAGYSTANINFKATAGYGSNSCTTTVTLNRGTMATSSTSSTSAVSLATNAVPASATDYTLTATITAVDGRGASASTTASITVKGYKAPLPNLTVYRVASSGSTTYDEAGTYIYIRYSATVTAVGNNSVQSQSVTYSGDISGTVSSNPQWIALAEDKGATFVYTVTDRVTSSVQTVVVSVAFFPLDLYQNGSSMGAAFGKIATKPGALEIAPNWALVASGKNNSFDYLPYSFHTTGGSSSTGYVKIATINITAGWVYNLIHFKVVRLVDPLPINLYMSFGGSSSSDPSLSAFYHDGFVGTSSNIDAFAYKTAPSTWEVYVHNYAAGNNMTVYTYMSVSMQQRCNITYDDKLLTSKPSGAISAISCAPTGVYSGTCPTAGATAAKTATVNHGLYFPLEVGTTVSVVFSNSNTASPTSLTLNVNNTGAYGIRLVRNASIQTLPFTGGLIAGVAYLLSFSGSYWFVMNFDDFYYNDDYVTDRGTSGNWTYRKWSSGDAECWGSHPMSVSGWSAWGVLYETNGAQYTYPSGLFIAEPNYNATPRGSGGLMMEATGAGSATQTPKLYAVRPNAGGTDTIYWYIHARGRWK